MLGVLLLLRLLHEPSRRWIDEKVVVGVRTQASGGRVAVGAYANVSINQIRGEATLEAGVVAQAQSPSRLQMAARTLAAAEAPMSTLGLAAALWGYSRVPATATHRLRELLRSVPSFVEVEPDRWQLGRRGV